MLYVRNVHLKKGQAHSYKDYDRKSSFEKKISGRETEGAWRQAEFIGGKPPIVK
jgi:hypothetical protein